MPRSSEPKMYSLRSSDQIADEGVIPERKELFRLGMIVVYLDNIRHHDMDDSGTVRQHDQINQYVLSFLE